VRHVTDARGTAVGLPDRVGRVVSLVPSLTEWLVVAGVGERLVGVTDWCLEPAGALAGLARVRGTKNPDLEAIRGLEPDLVVANAEENRKLDVQRLEAGGLAVFVTMPTTVAGAVAELRDLAAAVGDLPRAAALHADLVAAVATAYRRRPGRQVRYACAVWRDPWMWLGRRTYGADLLGLAGGEPVLDDPAARYPRLDPGTLAALAPELVLLPSEPYEFGADDADEAAAAFGGSRVELVDGRALTWYGPRIPAALASFRELLGRGAATTS
jgi:ABC-type Fe3+-hydroxamate transport system substrate-binding protein